MKTCTSELLFVVVSTASLSGTVWAKTERQEVVERLYKAANVLNEMMSTPDKGIGQEILEGAKAVPIVPGCVQSGVRHRLYTRQGRHDLPDQQRLGHAFLL